MITAKINLQNIDKNRLYKGEKGIYLNCVLIETPESEYSDYMIIQETTKDERKAGKKGEIIGNAKIFIKEVKELSEEEIKDLPFWW